MSFISFSSSISNIIYSDHHYAETTLPKDINLYNLFYSKLTVKALLVITEMFEHHFLHLLNHHEISWVTKITKGYAFMQKLLQTKLHGSGHYHILAKMKWVNYRLVGKYSCYTTLHIKNILLEFGPRRASCLCV